MANVMWSELDEIAHDDVPDDALGCLGIEGDDSYKIPPAALLRALARIAASDAAALADIGYFLNLPTTFAGSPETNVRGKPGRICINTSSSPPSLWGKVSGTEMTGWQEYAA